jgi:superfamily I DNA/RNA helicase
MDSEWYLCPKCGNKPKEDNNTCILQKELNDKIIISENETKEISENPEFFINLDNEQKKAILCQSKRTLIIAGAGSGKTRVIIKKIEYLIKNKKINPKEILAITFTRHAANELRNRIGDSCKLSTITTFNAFCEASLLKYEHLFYHMPYRVISSNEQKKLVNDCFNELKISVFDFIKSYYDIKFIPEEKKEYYIQKMFDDLFSVIDYIKNEGLDTDSILNAKKDEITYEDKKIIETIHDLVFTYNKKMRYMGLRDFGDQLLDFYKMITKNHNIRKEMQKYRYIFVDEYQDVNTIQVKIINELLLKESFLFVVGDPRQSIYGFRGSNLEYILNFKEMYSDSKTIALKNNYRSIKTIVNISNEVVKHMNIPMQIANSSTDKSTYLIECEDDLKEAEFVSSCIKRHIKNKTKERIFVLARTNSQLEPIAEKLKSQNIGYAKKASDEKLQKNEKENIILSTIHSIKGLEADTVFILGLVSGVFPSKTHDEKILCLIKSRYGKFFEEEEKRLFYVGITRAKLNLFLTYYKKKDNKKKNISRFISEELKKQLKFDIY